MHEARTGKPWWRSKRTWAAAAAVAAFAYCASLGPVFYCFQRGWIGWETYSAINTPRELCDRYIGWWRDLALDDDPDLPRYPSPADGHEEEAAW